MTRRSFLVLGSAAMLAPRAGSAQIADQGPAPAAVKGGGRAFLIVGIAPDAVDYSDPSIPPGVTPEMISGGLAKAQKRFTDQGDRGDLCLIRLDGSAEAVVTAQLTRSAYDCIVIGRGIRQPEPNLGLFEIILNVIHRHAPGAAIAFNTQPEDSPEAANRVLSHFKR